MWGKLKLTWNDVTGIHGILVLNEAEPIHELDFSDLASAMGAEVSLNVGLGDFGKGERAVSEGVQGQ